PRFCSQNSGVFTKRLPIDPEQSHKLNDEDAAEIDSPVLSDGSISPRYDEQGSTERHVYLLKWLVVSNPPSSHLSRNRYKQRKLRRRALEGKVVGHRNNSRYLHVAVPR